jgi:hypothetical protein
MMLSRYSPELSAEPVNVSKNDPGRYYRLKASTVVLKIYLDLGWL